MPRLAIALLLLRLTLTASAQTVIPPGTTRIIPLLPNEHWWGGAVNDGVRMPFTDGYRNDLYGNLQGNQAQPLLLSDKGRVIWSDAPFAFAYQGTALRIETRDSLWLTGGQADLRGAFAHASATYFPPTGILPDRLLFARPQYNTWIELTYDQNQADILRYARAIVDNGFPPGVLMIDDTWQEAYGTWRFHPGRFPDPGAMMEELHTLGFKVMLWVCPFVSPDTEVFRAAAEQGLFLEYPDNQAVAGSPRSSFGRVAMIGWWNGYSALLDLSNPAATAWFEGELQHLVSTYGVDGFKLDAGDASFYPAWLRSHVPGTSPNDHAELFARIGLAFPLNEYRATWKMGGQPLAQRLRDKGHDWADLATLMPNIMVQGLMGYAFTCPDMIGGGEFTSFLNDATIDQELIVRSAQVHALMPMMQFSVAPWRILDATHLRAVKEAVAIREKFTPLILRLAEQAARDG